jgi:hypothetical protein
MPAAFKYIPANKKDRQQFSTLALTEYQSQSQNFSTALRYFEGHPDAMLTVEAGEPDFNTPINLTKMTAERTAAFLFGEMPKFELEPRAQEETPEELYLRKTFEHNGGLPFFIKLATRGFLSGHNYVLVTEGNPYPRIQMINHLNVTVYWDVNDTEKVLWYEYRYYEDGYIWIKDFVHNDDNKWTINRFRGSKVENLDLLQVMAGSPMAWYYSRQGTYRPMGTAEYDLPVPPIIAWAHLPAPNSHYGLSEFSQKQLEDSINRTMGLVTRIVTESSNPVDVITGSDAEEVQDGDFVTITNPAAKAYRLEMKSDLTALMTTLNKMIEMYLAVARVVLLKGEAKDLQRVTNASVRTLFLDMLAKNNVILASYTWALKQIAHAILWVAYLTDAIATHPLDLPEVEVRTATPLPVDQLEQATINQMLHAMQVRSRRTIATSMGDDWNYEAPTIIAEMQEIGAALQELNKLVDNTENTDTVSK